MDKVWSVHEILQNRSEVRKGLDPETRRTDALEQIADSLLGIEEAIGRIADNLPS